MIRIHHISMAVAWMVFAVFAMDVFMDQLGSAIWHLVLACGNAHLAGLNKPSVDIKEKS